MDNNDNNKIFIPYGIKIEKEIFSGFGKKELKHFLISILLTVILSLVLFLITRNPLVSVVAALVGIAGGYNVSRRGAYSQSVVGIVKSIITYHRTQQKFDFVYQNKAMKNLEEKWDFGTSSPISENRKGGENADHSNDTDCDNSDGTDN